ncbi:MAG: PAS domain S-box protein [Candidatus Thorarchaeota archaeon]
MIGTNMSSGISERKILAIDDDEWFLGLLVKKFGDVDPSFKITTVYSAKSALEKLEVETFDCILCDHKLPGTLTINEMVLPADGINFLRKLQEELRIDIPVIFITGQGSEEIASQALLQGASGYFIKRVQPGYYSLMATSIRQTIDRYRLQNELKKSEARYRDLFENSTGLILIFDTQGTLKEANVEFFLKFGYDREEMGNLSFKELSMDEDRPIWADLIKKIKDGLSLTIGTILRGITKEGKIIHLDLTARPIYGKKTGEVRAIQALATDITHTIQTQQALIDSEEKHRKIFEGLIDTGIVLMTKDEVILDVNSAFTQISGLSKAETVGKPVSEIMLKLNPGKFDPSQGEIHSKDINWLHERFLNILDPSSSERHSELMYSITNRADNSKHIIESRGFTIEHSAGYQVAFVMRDISAWVFAEAERNAIAQRFRVLIERTPIGVWVSDVPDENTTYINESMAKMLGYSPHEIIGVPVLDFLTQESAKKLKETTHGRETGEELPESYELAFLHRSGKLIHTLVTGAAIQSVSGDIQETFGFIRDITEEKARASELQTTKEFLEEILTSIPEGVYVWDRRERVTMANTRMAKILEYTSSRELIGRSLYSFFPERDHEHIKELVKDRLRGNRSETFMDITYLTRKGKEVKSKVTSVPLLADSEVVGAVVTVTDITAVSIIEESFRQVQQELNILRENINQGIIYVDNLGKVLSHNSQAQELFGNFNVDVRTLNVIQHPKLKESGVGEKFQNILYQKAENIVNEFSAEKLTNEGIPWHLRFKALPVYNISQPTIQKWCFFIEKVEQNSGNIYPSD